jgi:hypothetical protein
MTVIPCQRNAELKRTADAFAEALRTEAHKIGQHGLTQREFYDSGIFRAAIERIRGQFAATMEEKRVFAAAVLNYLQAKRRIASWESAGNANRHDYIVRMPDQRIVAIELKGCLDGNNSTIFERPPQAQEFLIWSICTNPGSDPRKGVWSAVHTRLGVQMISENQHVDGLIVWDMACGTIGRPCPKIVGGKRLTEVGEFNVTPPCIYLFPVTVPHPRSNPKPKAAEIERVSFAHALHLEFQGDAAEIHSVDFEVAYQGTDTVRRTRIMRGGAVVRESEFIAIKRT